MLKAVLIHKIFLVLNVQNMQWLKTSNLKFHIFNFHVIIIQLHKCFFSFILSYFAV